MEDDAFSEGGEKNDFPGPLEQDFHLEASALFFSGDYQSFLEAPLLSTAGFSTSAGTRKSFPL